MYGNYSTYPNQNLHGAKISFQMIFSHVNVGSTQWPLHWAEGFLPNHNKKSRGQKCHHMVNMPRWKQ